MITIQDGVSLEISKDGLKAYINKVQNGNIEYNLDLIIKEIEKHIKYGLNKERIKELFENDRTYEKECIAQGKEPIHGLDGKINQFFKASRNLIPMLKEDGTVDYRELNSVNSTNKDTVLAEIIPPTEGKDGMKVTGEVIAFNKGKFPKFKSGSNTYISEDSLLLKAETDGIIEFKNGTVSVSELLTVRNVDSSIGNIDFVGNVTIDKDILNGFTVKSNGTVEVKGSLEGGYIESADNVLIRQGIQGFNKMSIKTDGDLGTKFIENAIVKVKGNITAEAIMHSDVTSDSNVLLIGKRGLIVGGTCRANYEIRAKTIGSHMATKTTIQVGMSTDIIEKYSEVEKELEKSKENTDKIQKSIKLLSVMKKSNKLDADREKMYEDLLRAESSLKIKNLKLQNEFNELDDKIANLSSGKVKVADKIYPGVKIIIGKNTFFVREEMQRCSFYIENKEIRVGPY